MTAFAGPGYELIFVTFASDVPAGQPVDVLTGLGSEEGTAFGPAVRPAARPVRRFSHARKKPSARSPMAWWLYPGLAAGRAALRARPSRSSGHMPDIPDIAAVLTGEAGSIR